MNYENEMNGMVQGATTQNESGMVTAEITLAMRQQIAAKRDELSKMHKKRVFVIAVKGWESDEKPLYIAYLTQPNLMQFSQYMSFMQKDIVQANQMLARNVFVDGDKELIDNEDLFLYGLMPQLSKIVDSREGELVNL